MQFECTNNIAENEAYILGLEAALELKIIIWRLNANNLSSERRMTNKR
jgi:ribonuclease HI